MIVVTGGAGFIGSNLVAALDARRRAPLVVVDRLRSGEKWRNVAKHEIDAIVPPDDVFAFLDAHRAEIDVVYHMGAISSTTETDADLIVRTNVVLSQNLWRWCAAAGARFVYASSAATYGDGSEGFEDDPTSEAMARLRPLNAYGWSKLLFDRWVVRQVANGDEVPRGWAGLKFFNVYGPNEYHKGGMQSVVSQLYRRLARGEPAVLFRSHHPDYPDGGQLRDFVSVDDCVDLMLWLGDAPEIAGIFNCGTGKARSFADLALAVFAALGRTAEIHYIDTPEQIREKYQYFTQARMARVAAAGYDHKPTSLEDGVANYVHRYLAAADPYR